MPRRPFARVLFVSIGLLLTGRCAVAQGAVTAADQGAWNSFSNLVDWLPSVLVNKLPGFDPDGTVRVYARPHLGDFFRPGYIRLPVGVRAKLTDQIEANADVQGFMAHGIDAPTNYGLATLNIGAKCDHILSQSNDDGFSVGFGYRTPLSRSPITFTDGYRHFEPYVSATRMVIPQWRVLGYTSVGVNLLEHSSLQSNFGRNQLHGNSIVLTDGVVRQWKRFQVSLTARYATTGLISDEFHQNFTLRPQIVVPWRLRQGARTEVFVTLDGRVTWGPEGLQTSTGTGLRVQFHLDRSTEGN